MNYYTNNIIRACSGDDLMRCHMSPFCDNYGNNSMCQGVRPICEHYKGQVSFERNIPDWLISKIIAKIESYVTSDYERGYRDALKDVLVMTYD